MNQSIKPQRIIFVDFNGVISYDPFWASLQNTDHPLHPYFEPIEQLLFHGENKIEGLIDVWMIGDYTSEQIHQLISQHTGAPYDQLFNLFCQDCAHLDISDPILKAVGRLSSHWYRILRTDNMDSFHRFTLPAYPQLTTTFDAIHNSYLLKSLKKTHGGQYFTSTASDFNLPLSQCVLIDDSCSVCQLFTNLGGQTYRTQTPDQVLSVLEKLIRI